MYCTQHPFKHQVKSLGYSSNLLESNKTYSSTLLRPISLKSPPRHLGMPWFMTFCSGTIKVGVTTSILEHIIRNSLNRCSWAMVTDMWLRRIFFLLFPLRWNDVSVGSFTHLKIWTTWNRTGTQNVPYSWGCLEVREKSELPLMAGYVTKPGATLA